MDYLTAEALDPNTPPDHLADLLEYRCMDAVLMNPALPLILLEDLDWFQRLRDETVLKVLQRPCLPEYVLSCLLNHPEARIRRNARMHVALGEEVEDWEPLLRELASLDCRDYDRQLLQGYKLIPAWLEPFLPVVIPNKQKYAVEKWNPRAFREADKWIKNRPSFSILSENVLRKISVLTDDERASIASTTEHPTIIDMLMVDRDFFVASCAKDRKTYLDILRDVLYRQDSTFLCFRSYYRYSEVILNWLSNRKAEIDFYTIVKLIFANCRRNPKIVQELDVLGCKRKQMAEILSIEDLEECFLSGGDWAAYEALERKDAPVWLISEAIFIWMKQEKYYDNMTPFDIVGPIECYQYRGDRLKWFCALLITESREHILAASRSEFWFMRFGAVIHPKIPLPLLVRRTRDPNRYVRFVAKARLANPEWSFAAEVAHG